MLTYNDITVETYVRMLHTYEHINASEEPLDDFQKQCLLISSVYNISVYEVESLPASRFRSTWEEVSYLVNKKYDFKVNTQVTYNNKSYVIQPNPFKFTVAQFADIEWVGANYQGLDRMIPTLALITTDSTPSRNKGGRPKKFYSGSERLSLIPVVSQFPTESAWGALDFFTKQLLLYVTVSQQCTAKTNQAQGILMEQLTTLTTGTQASSNL